MSEQLHETHEHFKPHEAEAERQVKSTEVSVEREEHKQHEQLRHAEHEVEHHAKSKHEVHHAENGKHHHEQPMYVNRELKSIALNRTLARVRRHLSSPEKALSKVVHQSAVQAVSEAGSKTIARPSGLLAGSFFALVGSSFVFYLAKHYGFRYNFALFFVFFVGGFAVGLVLELLIWIVRRGRASA